MNFKPYILQTLNELKIHKLTLIQEKVIPLILKNKNVIAVSQTGTGKTLAYCLPILEKIDLECNEIQAIIVSPTRELATQIYNVLKMFQKKDLKLKIDLLVGGSNFEQKIKQMQKKTGQILVATPNRLLATLKYGLNLNLQKYLKYVVYDEADMFIDQSFLVEFNQLKKRFFKSKPVEIILSATLHQDAINKLSKTINNPQIVNVSNSIWINDKIKHFLITSARNDKLDNLAAIVKQIKPYLCLIFVNNYKDIALIEQWFFNNSIPAIVLHGKLNPIERKRAFKKINQLKAAYVITTDLSSRGLDIDGVSHVISWNLPKDDIWYIHRSGRTSRSKYTGESYVMYDKNDEHILQRLTNKGLIWIPLKVNKNEDLIRHKMIYKEKKNYSTNKDLKYEKTIKKLQNQKKTAKVQPNYKKKIKTQIHKINQKIKHEAIEKKIKNNLIKKYKLMSKKN
ncbi:DEAD/DEAH box helicase [Mycoplasmoides alvi]|uniref:DEAD/DEAH box helicase n=1 Tax=Mycoplasmoides alvi TaxID=78580 RepID=UPI00051B8689|nr:DEAD/DEAH box helicase [Mycoplasmoides alvi]